MRLASCSCGHIFYGPGALMHLTPPTEEMVRMMVSHWKDGHDLVAASPTAFALIGVQARRVAAQDQAKENVGRSEFERITREYWRERFKWASEWE